MAFALEEDDFPVACSMLLLTKVHGWGQHGYYHVPVFPRQAMTSACSSKQPWVTEAGWEREDERHWLTTEVVLQYALKLEAVVFTVGRGKLRNLNLNLIWTTRFVIHVKTRAVLKWEREVPHICPACLLELWWGWRQWGSVWWTKGQSLWYSSWFLLSWRSRTSVVARAPGFP